MECEKVEDLKMVIADAIAHATDPPLLFFLHQQVEELVAILVEIIQGYLADPRGLGRKGTSGSSKRVKFGGDGELVSSPPSFSSEKKWELSSRIILPQYNHRPRGSNAVLKKSNWCTGQTLTPIGLERVFSRGAPKQWIRRWLQKCQIVIEGALK